MDHLEADLRARKLDRLLTTKDSKGNPHVAFEYLAQHERRLKASTLELVDKQTGQGLMRVQLTDNSMHRASRGRANFTSPLEEFNSALDDLADLAQDIHNKINARLMNTDAEERWVRRMKAALDFRIMAYPTSPIALAAIASATQAAAQLTSITNLALTAGDRIEVCVQAEPAVWWPAFRPHERNRLWDAEEDAWWPWRRASQPAAGGEMDVDDEAAAAAAAEATLAASAPTAPAPRGAFDALLLLFEWMNSRFVDAPGSSPSASPDPMPSISELWQQRCALQSRLQMFANSSPYKGLWHGQSGTAIMRTVYTEVKFYRGVGDFLHLFKHMACKTANEAVVEGMGSVWDDSASPKRHLNFETGVKEAVICYNGPPPHRPEAKLFLHKSLNTYFEGGPDKWNFAHEDKRFRGIVWAGGSKVIDRQLKVKPRLPNACYE
eukprot:CAMPEP_0183334074 /NCGR_PEP_ID=MMETSP0164_2-20130417/2787_1 /TAXON_ID=221442 /ORGANISM="Coccolithus pelagicus ssp braarudi, Strain PLY182g" /LENGTH=436 /DNA_ID=CAMNT_0025503143 /DNA_START=118 /DNA_END=1428 /DNA_ORIENTATION=-